MNKPHSLLHCLLALLTITLFSWPAFAGDEWKPISPADLAAKTPVVEKDADAEALFWEVRVDDSSTEDLALKHYVRLKIFTERGKEKYSKFEIPFFKGTKVKDVAARVIKADGTIVEIKKEDIFERTLIKADGLKLKVKSFAVPNIEPGVMLEYRYREVIENGDANMSLRLQRDIPIQTISYYVRPYAGVRALAYQTFNVPPDVKFVKEKDNFHRITMTNVPALREEPRMPPTDEVRSWIRIYYVNPGTHPTTYWNDITGILFNVYKDYLKPNDEVKRKAQEVVGNAATQEEKLARLYEFCQTQIRNITFDQTLTPDDRKKLKSNKSPGDTLKRLAGDAADVDLLFGGMAKALGIDARVAWSGDRSELFFNPKMTHISFLHPSSIAVKVGEKWSFYNPGSLYIPFGMLSWYEEGVSALITDEKQNIWTQTPVSGPERSNSKRTGKFKLLEDGTLEGEVRVEYTGHLAYVYKSSNDEDSTAQREANLRDRIKSRLSAAELSDIVIENVQTPGKPFVQVYKVRVPGYAQRTGKRLFFQPNYFEAGNKTLFVNNERNYDIYFDYGWSENDDVTIELPIGFGLDNADQPAPLSIAGVSEDTVQMVVTSATNGVKSLVYKRKFAFGSPNSVLLFKVVQYPAMKGLWEAINKVDTHALTLKQEAAPAPSKP